MVSLRPASPSDSAFLWEMLTHAASMEHAGADAVAEARADPYLASYVQGWGRDGDLGVIALAADEQPVGAAWLRLLGGASSLRTAEPGVPELAIAVAATHRGSGVGGSLLSSLIEQARERFPGIVLSVRKGNAAVRLYERFGFRVVREIENRVGTTSLAMRLDFDRAKVSVVATLRVRCAAVTAFEDFERRAAVVVARHGGAIERAVRLASDDGGQTFRELHVVAFPHAAAFAAYRADTELARLAPLREAAIVETELLIGRDAPEYRADA